MLATQVQYWGLQETARHNRATERLGEQTLNETRRHNIQTERDTDVYNAEIIRHNKMSERLGFQTLAEQRRHNIASESIGRMQAQAAYTSASASVMSANAALTNAQTQKYLSRSQSVLNYANSTYNNTRSWATKHEVVGMYGNMALKGTGQLVSMFSSLRQSKR